MSLASRPSQALSGSTVGTPGAGRSSATPFSIGRESGGHQATRRFQTLGWRPVTATGPWDGTFSSTAEARLKAGGGHCFFKGCS